MSQNNLICGVITQICTKDANGAWQDVQSAKGIEGGLPVFVVISERVYDFSSKSFRKQFVPFNGFLAEGQSLAKKQKVFADFIVDTFVNEDGFSAMSFKITHIELDSDVSAYKPSETACVSGADLIKMEDEEAEEAEESDVVEEADESEEVIECELDDADLPF